MSDADYGGKSGGSSSLFSSPLSLGGVGTAAAGGAGLAGLFSMGETAPPWEFGQVANNAATLEGESGTLFGEGQTFTNQGAQALELAQNGQLTQPQQAHCSCIVRGWAIRRRRPMPAWAAISIRIRLASARRPTLTRKSMLWLSNRSRSTIALGLGETSAGSSFSGQALGYESAANQRFD